jgi:CelD/BcsL family acetyltransferase involved in cellulose biosynthesis
MNVSQLKDRSEWNHLVESSSSGHFFNLPQWSDAICNHFRIFEPASLRFSFDSQDTFIMPMVRRRIFGGIASTLFSLPFGTFGGIIGATAPSSAQVEEIAAYLARDRALKITVHGAPFKTAMSFGKFTRESLTTQVMMLDRPYERIEKELFAKSKRESVGRARRRGVIVRKSKETGCVEAFLKVVALAENDRGWATRYPEAFIREIIAFPQAQLWTAWVDGHCASGIVAFCYKKETTAWLGAMDHTFKAGQPMNLLKAEMMRCAIDEGCTRLDLGASIGIASLKAYKAAFGCVEVDLPVYTLTKPVYTFYSRIRSIDIHEPLFASSRKKNS